MGIVRVAPFLPVTIDKALESKNPSDRTHGLISGFLGQRGYSCEPPSNRTSHSHGIRLYEHAACREVNPDTLSPLVRRLLGCSAIVRVTSAHVVRE